MCVLELRYRSLVLAAVMATSLVPTLSGADPSGHSGKESGRHDHDRARHALQQGEIRPIAEILRRVQSDIPGEIIEVELERETRSGGLRWVYELTLIGPDGQRLEARVDAATAELLEVEED
jgi:uncharacterized membrane protein YkoI